MNILIAEDENISAEVLTKFLEPYGKCIVVNDGQAAVDLFTEKMETTDAFDLVCLDILMPVLDGICALKKIRDYESSKGVNPLKAVKVIMTTCVDTPSDVLNAFRSGCEGYVVKPIQKAGLIRELRKINLI